MHRKVGYIFGAAVGSFAVVCGFKNQYLKDSPDELQFIQAVSAQDVRKGTEDNKNSILLLNPSVRTAGYEKQDLSLQSAIVKARDLACRKKDEVGAPGLVIGVSINGKTVWAEGEYHVIAAHSVAFFYRVQVESVFFFLFALKNLDDSRERSVANL
jgi:hypothetical protein